MVSIWFLHKFLIFARELVSELKGNRVEIPDSPAAVKLRSTS